MSLIKLSVVFYLNYNWFIIKVKNNLCWENKISLLNFHENFYCLDFFNKGTG